MSTIRGDGPGGDGGHHPALIGSAGVSLSQRTSVMGTRAVPGLRDSPDCASFSVLDAGSLGGVVSELDQQTFDYLLKRSWELERAIGRASLAIAEIWYELDRIVESLPDKPYEAEVKARWARSFLRRRIEEIEILRKEPSEVKIPRDR
jgi:hypothetical protein